MLTLCQLLHGSREFSLPLKEFGDFYEPVASLLKGGESLPERVDGPVYPPFGPEVH